MLMSAVVYPLFIAFWIFFLYVLWMIVGSLKRIGDGLHEIALALKERR